MTMNSCVSLLLLLSPSLVSAGNRPGSAGGCDGAGPTINIGRPGGFFGGGPPNGGGGAPPNPRDTADGAGAPPNPNNARKLIEQLAMAARKRRELLGGTFSGGLFDEFALGPEEIEICCEGNGDFDFLMRDLDIGGLAIASEAQGFKEIPGDSLWTCREQCRDPANGFAGSTEELFTCYDACACRQQCPTSGDFLTTECKDTRCVGKFGLELEVCLEDCEQECGERCRGTLNGYIVPLDVYKEGLEILDCQYGDLIPGQSPQRSCDAGAAFWRSIGFTCDAQAFNGLGCTCDNPGFCLNEVYPCNYPYYCISESPSLTPSTSPSIEPTMNPTPRPTKGKGKRWTPEPTTTAPTKTPVRAPTKAPARPPTNAPTKTPVSVPTGPPDLPVSDAPVPAPTKTPVNVPVQSPVRAPVSMPVPQPTEAPEKDDDEWKGKDDDDDWKGKDDDDWKGKDDDDDWNGKNGKNKNKDDDE